MMNIAGLGRLAAATIVLSGLAFGSAARAQEVSEEQLKAARAAMDAIGATTQLRALGRGGVRVAGRGRRPRGLARQAQLRVDVREVPLDRAGAYDEAGGDRLVAHAVGDELEDSELALAELG